MILEREITASEINERNMEWHRQRQEWNAKFYEAAKELLRPLLLSAEGLRYAVRLGERPKGYACWGSE